jgi:hypothetical protein
MENGEILRLKPKTYEIETPDGSSIPTVPSIQPESTIEVVNSLLATQTLTRRNATRRTVRGGRGRGTRGRGRGQAARPPQTLIEQVPEAAIEVVEAVVQNMFTREQMRVALVRSNMNADAAINILFDGGDAEDEEEDEEEDEFEDEFDDEDDDGEEENEDVEEEDEVVADSDTETALDTAPNIDDSHNTNHELNKVDTETNATKPDVDSHSSLPKSSSRQVLIDSVDPVPNITVFDQITLVRSDYSYKSITSLSSDLVALSDNYIDLVPETDAEAVPEKSIETIKAHRKYNIDDIDFGDLKVQETVPLPLSCPNTPVKDKKTRDTQ